MRWIEKICRFIQNFSHYSRHLTHLCKKNVTFNWTPKCQKAFEQINKCIYSTNPDFNKEFCITTDASKQACGAVLTQSHDGVDLPVAYASRTFTKGESNKVTNN